MFLLNPYRFTVPWITLVSGDWAGDTGSFTRGTGTVTGNASDKNIRTSSMVIAANYDFDFKATVGGSDAGFAMGISTSGSGTGSVMPTSTNPVFYAKAQGTGPGWNNNGGTVEAAKSANWCANKTIELRRRGSALYGYIDGVLDRTSSQTSTAAMQLIFGTDGSGSGWSVSGAQYRAAPAGGLGA